MNESVNKLIEKISSYEIFNHLLPGVVFSYAIEVLVGYTITTNEIWKDLFIFYFVGVVLSRIGSVLFDAVLYTYATGKKDKDYSDYIEATKRDTFIKKLNESNNMYRTMFATFVVLSFVEIFDYILGFINVGAYIPTEIVYICIFLLLALLFAESHKKQTKLICERIEHCKLSSEKGDRDKLQ